MEITISDVAERAGVSKSTVSLVLNGRPGVSPETRELVLRAAAELGYATRRASGTAPAGRTLLIVCQRYPGRSLDVLGHVYSAYIAGVKQACSAHGCDLVVLPVSAQMVDGCRSVGELMLDTVRADGVLLLGLRYPEDRLLSLVRGLGVPFMALGRHWAGADFSCIGVDDSQALMAVVEHLVALGHQEIALVGDALVQPFMWHQLRLWGFRQGLERAGMAGLVDRVVVARTPDEAVAEVLRRWPRTSAIVGMYDAWAQGVVRALEDRGLHVPRDVSVVGFDNTNALGLDLGDRKIELTSVDPRQADAGRLGTESLLRCIEEREIAHVQITLHWRLVVRSSSAPPKAGTDKIDGSPAREG